MLCQEIKGTSSYSSGYAPRSLAWWGILFQRLFVIGGGGKLPQNSCNPSLHLKVKGESYWFSGKNILLTNRNRDSNILFSL